MYNENLEILELLDNEKKIKEFIAKIEKSNLISIDIEFMRRSTFFPEPCVIQFSNGTTHGCIDLTINIDYKTIFEKIFNRDKTIIIHSCRQDLEILHMILGYIPNKIFDTQFAASFLGYKYQIGYAELISDIFNITVDKSEKMTNWKKRPLSNEQIKYALNDVIYLNKLHTNLQNKLINSQKSIYFQEEFKNYLNDIEWNPKVEDAWSRIKSMNNLSKNVKNAVKAISIWRERKAINLNLPRNWILSEKDIIEISKNFSKDKEIYLPPKNKILDKNKDSDEIKNEIINFSNSSSQMPKKEKKIKSNSNHKKTADDLYEYYKSISVQNKISYQIVSPKKMILNYLKNNDKNSRLINGWRRNLIDINEVKTITNDYFNGD